MGNVLKMAKQQIIQGYVELGWSNRAIHRATGVHRDTISAYRKRSENGPKVPTDSGGVDGQNGPKVPTDSERGADESGPKAFADSVPLPRTNSPLIFSHRATIRDKYLLGLSAQRIYQDLVEEALYTGSYETVKRYVRKLRKRAGRYFQRLPTIAGKEAQIDFGKAPCRVVRDGKRRRPWLFKATLSFSGHSYEELVWKQDLETFLRCLEHAFLAFGGVPETVKLDNLKSGVLLACLYEPEINPAFLAFCRHCGCMPNPCAPRSPHHKGRVERDVGYTKDNALKARDFDSLEQGNLFLKHWNKRWARTRIHGSTRQQVWKRFVEGEKPLLRPLPPAGFTYFRVGERKVDVHGHVEVSRCFYSVPHRYIGQRLTVHYNHQWIRVFEGYTLLVEHRPLLRKGRWVTLPEHTPPYVPASREQAEGWQCIKAKKIGPSCHRLVYKILCSDHPLAIRKTRGILALEKKYGAHIVEQACAYALSAYLLQYRAVARQCAWLTEKAPTTQPQLTQHHELIRQLDLYDNLVQTRSL
jgi:transposase